MVGLGSKPHLQRHRMLVGDALAAKSTGSPSFTHERVNECNGDLSPTILLIHRQLHRFH